MPISSLPVYPCRRNCNTELTANLYYYGFEKFNGQFDANAVMKTCLYTSLNPSTIDKDRELFRVNGRVYIQ